MVSAKLMCSPSVSTLAVQHAVGLLNVNVNLPQDYIPVSFANGVVITA